MERMETIIVFGWKMSLRLCTNFITSEYAYHILNLIMEWGGLCYQIPVLME